MPTYQIVIRDVSFRGAIIEAENEEEAWEKATELEGDETKILDGGEWEVESVTLI